MMSITLPLSLPPLLILARIARGPQGFLLGQVYVYYKKLNLLVKDLSKIPGLEVTLEVLDSLSDAIFVEAEETEVEAD